MSLMSRDDAFAPKGVLQPGVHEELFNDLDKLAATAGLAGGKKFIVQSCKPYLDAQELASAAKLKQKLADGKFGVIYGPKVPRVPERFMALTGAFMRNYLNARFMTLQQCIEEHRHHGTVDATVLLIPDFHVPSSPAVGGHVQKPSEIKGADKLTTKPQFVVEMVSSMLLDRIATGKFTYLYSEDLSRLGQDYGPYVAKLVGENYLAKVAVDA